MRNMFIQIWRHGNTKEQKKQLLQCTLSKYIQTQKKTSIYIVYQRKNVFNFNIEIMHNIEIFQMTFRHKKYSKNKQKLNEKNFFMQKLLNWSRDMFLKLIDIFFTIYKVPDLAKIIAHQKIIYLKVLFSHKFSGRFMYKLH